MDQRRARAFGVLYLITFVTSIPALWLYQPVLDDPVGYIAGAGHDKGILLGALLKLLLIIADIGTAALVFYRDGLGLETKGIVAAELVDQKTDAAGAIVIFKLDRGLVLALYPRSELGKDAEVAAGPPQSGQFSLGQLVASRADVDRILDQAAAAGAIVTPPHDRPWGIYSGYFRDPDGHLWEIVWNPGHTSDPT